MDQTEVFRGVSTRQIREICVDALHEEQRLLDISSGPRDNEDRLSKDSRTNDLNEMKEKDWSLINVNHVDAVTGEATIDVIAESLHCLTGDVGNCLGNVVDNPEDKGLLNLQAVKGTNSVDAEREDVSVPNLRLSMLKARFEARLNANSQETLRSNADLKDVFQNWEFQFQKQNELVFEKEEEVSKLQREIQKLRELITVERNSRTTQVVELQEKTLVLKNEFGQLQQEVNNIPSQHDASLATLMERTFGQLFRDKLGVDKDLRKRLIQLDCATKDIKLKTSEGEQLTANITSLAEANSKLEQKVDKIQQELWKEKEGHHGSYVDGSQTPFLWENLAKEMFSSIAAFSNVLSKYKDSNGANPAHSWIASDRGFCRTRIARDHHWTYYLKHAVCNGLFRDFEYETLTSSHPSVLFLDQEERVNKCLEYYKKSENENSPDRASAFSGRGDRFDILFFRYFSSLGLLPPDINQLRPCITDYDDLIGIARNKLHLEIHVDKRRVLGSLIIAAKKVWDFHKLCLSFNPPATIFRVSPGDPFNADYMESIEILENNDGDTVPTVGFMVFPGFRLRKSIIKCRVYLTLKT